MNRTELALLTDEEVVDRVRAGETALYEIIMRRYNQRLYRVVRSILRDEDETEDVMQDAYVRAYEHLHQFERRAPFAAWLTRIAVHEALARARRSSRIEPLSDLMEDGELTVNLTDDVLNPEQTTTKAELRSFLEEAILALPEQYRTVLMLRDVEELSTSETATTLNLTEENVKVRLHRGRALVREHLFERVGSSVRDAFPFMGARCDRMVEAVFKRLRETEEGRAPS